MFSFFKKKTVPLIQQLHQLELCGIALRDGITIDDLLDLHSEEAYQKHPYVMLLIALGGVVDEAPYDRYLSNNVWHFDVECIEDHGAYVDIATRMKVLAEGNLPLENITDYVDVAEEQARLSFVWDGQPITWEAQVRDDWVDSTIFSRLVTLHASKKPLKNFIYAGLGQDCLIGYATEEQRQQLNLLLKGTGVSFVEADGANVTQKMG